MLAAGLKGIENGYECPPPVEENVYEMPAEERERRGIAQLPGDLDDAIKTAEHSELMRETLGDHVFEKFIENKKIEWHKYRSQVTEYELDQYLPVL
jgi:glutamine synthetase